MILSLGGEENCINEIPAVTDLYTNFMYGIIACSNKFYDVHLPCSLTCITYHAACWMITREMSIKGVCV